MYSWLGQDVSNDTKQLTRSFTKSNENALSAFHDYGVVGDHEELYFMIPLHQQANKLK
jgi:hypothetical protein